jgi:putative two-component system hydrogenase maturation factor HypX/HoxX
MRILLLCHAFNSLSQRLFVELREHGHQVSVEFDINDAVTREALALFRPDAVVAPFLKRRIPEDVWRAVPCLVIHPGPLGDRGPSALDWAILDGAEDWGVTVLQAEAELDGGAVWQTARFPMRATTKGSLYRHEVTETAVTLVRRALARLAAGDRPAALATLLPAGGQSRWRPAMRQIDRAIDWRCDDTATVLRKLRSGDGSPGVLDTLAGLPVHLFDGHDATGLSGPAGTLLARSGEAICRATVDGAVWIGRMRRHGVNEDQPLKLPAVLVAERLLGSAAVAALPEQPGGYPDLWYEEWEGVGFLHFPFYNGALGTTRCRRLLEALRVAQGRDTRVLVLMGGPDFWCNGIDLNSIEAAPSPADESWNAINAIDDVAEALITTPRQFTIAALSGNAGAGGVFLALAADRVWARTGVVLNPHYKGMGNLYGSEYWTYLLPRRCGSERARHVTEARLPMGTPEALRLRLIDEAFGTDHADFRSIVAAQATALALDPMLPALLAEKRQRRTRDETITPLAAYRADELAQMRLNFYGFDPSYHVARYNFVFKVPKSRTPLSLARHRQGAVPGHDHA